MGNTGAAVLAQVTDLAPDVQQRALRTPDTPHRARVPSNAPPQDDGGTAPYRPACIQSEKMKPRPVLIAHIVQPRPPQMLGADRVKKRRHAILHDHRIIGTSRLGKRQAVLESLAASAYHGQPNPAGVHVRLGQGLLQLLDCAVCQGEQWRRRLAWIFGLSLVFHVPSYTGHLLACSYLTSRLTEE
jgi:hypothetical protein